MLDSVVLYCTGLHAPGTFGVEGSSANLMGERSTGEQERSTALGPVFGAHGHLQMRQNACKPPVVGYGLRFQRIHRGLTKEDAS